MNRALKATGLVLLATLLSVSTLIFSAIPLLALRRMYGSGYYWALTLVSGLALALSGRIEAWAPFMCMVILIGFYAESESNGLGLEASSLVSLLGTSGFILLIVGALAKFTGFDFAQFLTEKVSEIVGQLISMEPALKIDVESVLKQVPSAVVIALISSLWVALLIERRFHRNNPDVETLHELSTFSIPDSFIWIFLLSVVGSFMKSGSDPLYVVAVNIFNVFGYLYFLQGLAVIGTFFKAQKVGPYWRSFGYFILIGQLFLLVSFIGFIDFWLDFRRRILKKSAETMGEV